MSLISRLERLEGAMGDVSAEPANWQPLPPAPGSEAARLDDAIETLITELDSEDAAGVREFWASLNALPNVGYARAWFQFVDVPRSHPDHGRLACDVNRSHPYRRLFSALHREALCIARGRCQFPEPGCILREEVRPPMRTATVWTEYPGGGH